MSLSGWGGEEQAVPSPTTRGFLHQSSVCSPHSWRKARTPEIPSKKALTGNIHCALHLPRTVLAAGSGGRCLQGVLAEAWGTRRKQPQQGLEVWGRATQTPWGRAWGRVLADARPPSPVCLAVSVTVSVLLSASRQLDLAAQCPRAPANLCSFPLLTLSGEITPRTAPLVMPAPTRPVQRGRRPRPPRVPLRALGRGSWGAGVPHGRAVSRTTWPLPGRVATRAAVPAVLDQALGARLSSPSSTRLCCDGHGRPPACSLS